jgi:hypothetical protein
MKRQARRWTMSTSRVTAPVVGEAERARRFGVWSLLMLVFLIPAAIVAAVVGLAILGNAGLEGSEPMSEQGTAGWTALVLTYLILMAPMFVGVFLGAKAHGLGERRLGTTGIVVDGAILVLYTIAAFGGALTQ